MTHPKPVRITVIKKTFNQDFVDQYTEGVKWEPKPESTEGRPWGQPLKKAEGAPLNLG